MDFHTRIVGILHIAFSLLTTFVSFIVLAASSAWAFSTHANLPGFLFKIGAVAIVVRIVLTLGQIIGGIALLKGKRAGRILILIFGVLDLFVVPLGTALGIYTFWVLLRKPPVPTAASPDPTSGL